MKHSEKFIFLFVVIGAIFFARVMYPNLSALPRVGSVDQSAIAVAQTQVQTNPPLLTLPQPPVGSQASLSSPDNVGPIPNSLSQTSTTASTNIDSVFSKIGDTPAPSFDRQAYMVADITTGAVLSGENTAKRWPTASLTKLMTATVIFDNIPTSTLITITPQMFAADPDEQTLVVGGTYSVEDLLHCLLMPSSNVAAEAMATYFGRTQFLAEMNQRAKEWGMTDTYFDDPSGISAANESTANDMLILAQHVYNDYPGILALTDTHQTTITELNSGKKILVTSINDFAGEPNFIGGKTGHTEQAGGNLLSIFNYNGHPVIIIVLDTVDRFGDTSKLFAWFKANFK